MATLLSPGVNVSVIDESFRSSAGPGTVPLVVIATEQDKTHPSGTGIATGTQAANANKLYLVTSQRELANTFGDATFKKNGGSAVQADELNEYGLFAVNSYLGVSNQAYVLRADVNLGELNPSPLEPTSDPVNGTIWFDTTATSYGVFSANGNATPGLAWDTQTVSVKDQQSETENVVRGNVGFLSTQTSSALNVTGNLTINGTNVSVASGDSFDDIVAAINTASISNIKASVLIYAERSWIQIVETTGGTLTVGGDSAVLTPLGLTSAVAISFPKESEGNVGDFAIVTTNANNFIFEKIRAKNLLEAVDSNSKNNWYLIGSTQWLSTSPTAAVGSSSPSAATIGHSFDISDGTNTVSVTLTGTDVADTVGDINTAVAALNASVRPTISAQASGTALAITNWSGGPVSFTNGTGTALDDFGLSNATGKSFFYASHTSIPSGEDSDSVWIKTTSPNNGSNWVVKTYSNSTNQFTTENAPFYKDDDSASKALGLTAATGTKYVRYNSSGASSAVASHALKQYKGFGTVTITGTVANATYTASDQFNLNGIVITLSGTSVTDVVSDINNAVDLPDGITAREEDGFLIIENSNGLSIIVSEKDGTPLADAGITAATYSNWETLNNNSLFVQSATTPTSTATEGTLWYDEQFIVDIMVSDGDEWKGYKTQFANTDPNGVQLTSLAPTTQSDGTPLVDNDLWINTSDSEAYPKLYRYSTTTSSWVLIDNTDQTTPFGIVFADARWTSDGSNSGSQAAADLVSSDFVDPDAPDPRNYPSGMLLFNTRLSTRNVKEWKPTHLSDNIGDTYEVGAASFANTVITSANQGRWVTISGNQQDGSPYMGRKAQRIVVVRELASSINDSEEIRADEVDFNLLAVPGYPELVDEMVNLNTDRRETAFIVADSPARLGASTSDLQAWATNSNNAPSNGEDGLVTKNTYVGVYYPWGLTSDVEGVDVMVPPSHMMLRTIALSDQKSYPWYAPAGFARGLVTNVTNVGYLTTEGEFTPLRLNQGQRDVLQTNSINPISFAPSRGIVAFGQKTTHPVASALDRVNVVRLVNFLRRNFDEIAKAFLFEPNDQQTRDAARDVFNRFLGNMVTTRAISDFAVVSDLSNNTPVRITRNELWIDVAIVPIRSVEFIYIPVRVLNPGDSLSA